MSNKTVEDFLRQLNKINPDTSSYSMSKITLVIDYNVHVLHINLKSSNFLKT